MIISHKYKFIFIKTLKTAGTSLEVFLSSVCNDTDIVTPIYPYVAGHQPRNYRGLWNPIPDMLFSRNRDREKLLENLCARKKFYNHISASSIRFRVGKKVWDTYFKFCVERNPWDKTLSHFYHLKKIKKGSALTLENYLDNGNLCLNYPIYTDRQDQIIVDKVIKYESLNDELSTIFEEIGIDFNGQLSTKAKSDYRDDRRPYQDVFSDSQREFIGSAFKKEIDMHGYLF